MKKKLLVLGFLVIFLVGGFWVFINLVQGRTSFLGRAAGDGMFDANNSYVFASPVVARSGGDIIRVTVFVLSNEGRGISGQSVDLACQGAEACPQVAVSQVQSVTDSLGQAVFDVSSPTSGRFEMQAAVGAASIPQTVKLVFE